MGKWTVVDVTTNEEREADCRAFWVAPARRPGERAFVLVERVSLAPDSPEARAVSEWRRIVELGRAPSRWAGLP